MGPPFVCCMLVGRASIHRFAASLASEAAGDGSVAWLWGGLSCWEEGGRAMPGGGGDPGPCSPAPSFARPPSAGEKRVGGGGQGGMRIVRHCEVTPGRREAGRQGGFWRAPPGGSGPSSGLIPGFPPAGM